MSRAESVVATHLCGLIWLVSGSGKEAASEGVKDVVVAVAVVVVVVVEGMAGVVEADGVAGEEEAKVRG